MELARSTDGDPDSSSPRARLLSAVVDQVAECGFESATVRAICRRAGVAQAVFVQLFPDKKACFLAACRALAEGLIAKVGAALEGAHDWREQVRTGLDAFLTYLADHPTAARACLWPTIRPLLVPA